MTRVAPMLAVLINLACQPLAPTCGDAELDAPEQCDDGNAVGGDGCSASCALEEAVCGDGALHADEACDDGPAGSATCSPEGEPVLGSCGDGVVGEGEDCDDGNAVAGDGCDACVFERRCGDGVLDEGEACDDGNELDDDGCASDCAITSSTYARCDSGCVAPDACTPVGGGTLCTRACAADAECPDGGSCREGVCLWPCEEDEACDLGQRCESGACTP